QLSSSQQLPTTPSHPHADTTHDGRNHDATGSPPSTMISGAIPSATPGVPQTPTRRISKTTMPAAIKKLTEELAKMTAAMETMHTRVQGIENNILQMQISAGTQTRQMTDLTKSYASVVAGHDALKNDFTEVSTRATRAVFSAETVKSAQVNVQETALRIRLQNRSILEGADARIVDAGTAWRTVSRLANIGPSLAEPLATWRTIKSGSKQLCLDFPSRFSQVSVFKAFNKAKQELRQKRRKQVQAGISGRTSIDIARLPTTGSNEISLATRLLRPNTRSEGDLRSAVVRSGSALLSQRVGNSGSSPQAVPANQAGGAISSE
ncbi:MAG: hypothetical protein CYPHOPRED_004908, partial [Cyphobasidiales sp. Tagirdzhanova-0007]